MLSGCFPGVIHNNGHTNVKPKTRDGLWYYVTDKDGIRRFSYAFKGFDAFWIVQFLYVTDNADRLEDLFFLWAKGVNVHGCPVSTSYTKEKGLSFSFLQIHPFAGKVSKKPILGIYTGGPTWYNKTDTITQKGLSS